jgi:iron(III) transport system permease protein
MWGWRSSRTLVVGLATVLFGLVCLLPAVSVLAGAWRGLAGLSLDERQWRLLANTALLGSGTAIVATAIGAPLGLALARAGLPRRWAFRLALSAPAVLPPYVVGLAWIYLAGSRGTLATLVGPERIAAWIYSLPAAVVVLGLVFYPLTMLATEVAVGRVDGRLEEAGLLVAGPRRVTWRITLPLAAPGILAGALIVFVLAVSEFGVPGVLQVRVYTTEVFTAFAALYDPARAARTAAPLLLLCGGAAAAALALVGERQVGARRKAPTPPAMMARHSRRLAAAATTVVILALALPMGVLGREASGSRSIAGALAGSGEAIVNSLWLAIAGASIVVAIAVWLGYARARLGGAASTAIDVLLVVLFAWPSTLVGVGLIGVWNRGGYWGAVYGTEGMLIVASVARLLPIAVLALAASFRTVPVSHEEAAAVSGARWLRTVWRLVLPQAGAGILAVWVVTFVFAFGELGASILVAPPGESTLPIRIYTIIANAPSSTVAALALLQSAVVLTPLATLGAVLARREGT